MFWLKQCPRCNGDLVAESDHFGSFVSCMQCGLCRDVPSERIDLSEISLEPVPVPTVPRSDSGTRRRISHGGRHTYRSLNKSAA